MLKRLLFATILLSTAAWNTTYGQLVVNANNNATTLAQTLVGNGVTVTNATYTGNAASAGIFSGGLTVNLGIGNGVTLSSGNAVNAAGNASVFGSDNLGAAGDADLTNLATGITHDAAILEFDFKPQGDTLNFKYVFASEEYPNYTCSEYNDIFAFLITGTNPFGPNYNKKNVALIPGTTLPVSINTVNKGSASAGYNSSDCLSTGYSQYYHNNINSVFSSGITFDGYTTVFTATVAVVPCQTYHIKLAIADVSDYVLNSAVFLQANSFSSSATSVTASYDPGFTTIFEGCTRGWFTINAPEYVTTSTPLNYTIHGTATSGSDYTALSGTTYVQPGTSAAIVYVDGFADGITESPETVTIVVTNPCTGLVTDSATLTISDPPADTAYASKVTACLGETVQLTATGGGTYSWSPPSAVSNPNIATPTAVINSLSTFTANITLGTCNYTWPVTVFADSFNITAIDSSHIPVCPGTTVTLAALNNQGVGPYTYNWSPSGLVDNPNAQLVHTTPTNTTTYNVTGTDGNGCSATSSVTVVTTNNPMIQIGQDTVVCPENLPIVLTVPGGPFNSYNWSTGQTTPSISVTTTGSYWVSVTNNSCTFSSDTAYVTVAQPVDPALADTGYCAGGNTTLSVAGNYTNIVWSTGATTPTINVTAPGTYSYTANDSLGCAIASDTATVTEYPVPTVNASAAADTICPGSTTVISSNATNATGYLWQPNGETTPNITATGGGTYIVLVGNALCNATDTVVIEEYVNPNPTINGDTAVCNGQSVTFSLLNGPFVSYIWSNGATTPSITVSTSGTYNVTVNDGNCTWVSNSAVLSNYPTPVATLSDTGACVGLPLVLSVEPGLVNIVWSTGATTPVITVTANDTVYYTATDVNGCNVVSDTAVVTFQNAPTVNATASPDTICVGSSSTLSANAVGNNLNYLWSPTGETTPSITTSTPGTYTVVVRDAFCPAFDTVELYQYPYVPVTIGNDTTVCNGQNVTLTASGGPYVSYTWSNGANTPTITVNTPGDYWLTVNDGTCDIVSDTITLGNFPTPTATLTDTGACQGTPINLSTIPGATNIVWSTGATTSTITVTSNDTVYYTATDANGCNVVSDTASVTFEVAPTVNVTASVDTICQGATSTLSSNATGNNLTYVWQPNGETTADITVSAAGTYIVNVSNGFCPAADTIEIFQYNHAPITLGNDTDVCVGESVTLTPSGAPYVTYNWSNTATTPSITVSATGTYSVTVNDGTCTYVSDTVTLGNHPVVSAPLSDTSTCEGNTIVLTANGVLTNIVWSTTETTNSINVTVDGDYSYTGQDVFGCTVYSDTATVSFDTVPAITVTASPDTLFCPNSTSTLTASATGNNITYVWDGGATTPSITVNAAGTYHVTVSDGGCPGVDSVTVVRTTHAPVTLRSDTTVCPGSSVTLSPSGSPYVSYNWSNSATTATVNVSATGDYSVTVNDGTCTYVSDTFTLSNLLVATPVAHSDTDVCANQPVTLTADAGYSNYGWSNGAGNGQSVTVTTPNSYSYTATDVNGCTVTSTNADVTNRPYPTITLTATPPALCVGQGQTTTLDAGSQTGTAYQWNPGGATTNTITISQTGTYTVTADLNNCISTGSITINSADTPTLALRPLYTSCCEAVILDPAPGQNYTYVWSDNSTGNTLTVNSTNNNTDTYSVTATNASGCTASQQVNVRVKCLQAAATATPDSVQSGSSSQLNVSTSYTDSVTYVWNPASTLNDATISNPTATPTTETTYTVLVTDGVDGCVDSATVTVYIINGDKVIMPNAFTPNGDGHNDTYYPVLLGSYQQVIEFRIYDRWGAMVHNSIDPWSGTFNSAMQPVGTYLYYIVIRTPDSQNPGTTKDISLNGSFTLLH